MNLTLFVWRQKSGESKGSFERHELTGVSEEHGGIPWLAAVAAVFGLPVLLAAVLEAAVRRGLLRSKVHSSSGASSPAE